MRLTTFLAAASTVFVVATATPMGNTVPVHDDILLKRACDENGYTRCAFKCINGFIKDFACAQRCRDQFCPL